MRLLLPLLVACSPEPEPAGGSPTVPTGTEDPGPDPLALDLPQGTFLVGLAVAPVAGLVVPFQFDLETRETDAGPIFTRFDVRAVGTADALSEILTSVADVPVSADGFTAEIPEFTLPAAYSITASDVVVQPTLVAETASPAGFCGEVTGSLVTFDLDLAGSTFGAIPWDERAAGAPGSCDAGPIQEIPRIATCPAVTAGVNTDFPSGGQLRSFEVVVPADYDPLLEWPLIAVFHGFGGTSGGMLDGTGLRPYADSLGAILVVPQGEDDAGSPLFDAFGPPESNLDLVLFDDLLTCASASFSIDPDRIHVTGMSNGGLMTGYLAATRSNVIASAAPMSGGIGTPVIDSGYAMPALVVWGGATDVAFQQDFDVLANQMIDLFLDDGQFVVACDHGLGHTLDPSFWQWVLPFLLDHPRDLSAEPYAAGLPPSFPAYCAIR